MYVYIIYPKYYTQLASKKKEKKGKKKKYLFLII